MKRTKTKKSSIRQKKTRQIENRPNKTYRKNKSSNKMRRSKGGVGPSYPDRLYTPSLPSAKPNDKQVINDVNASTLYIINELIGAESNLQETQMLANNTPLPLDLTVAANLMEYNPFPFWKNLFTSEEFVQIIEQLRADICGEIREIVPAFDIKELVAFPEPVKLDETTAMYNIDNIFHFTRNPEEVAKLKATHDVHLPERSKIMCATLMILGIISSKMQDTRQEYGIIAKGGAAVSLALSRLTDKTIRVPVNDLDFRIISNANQPMIPYNQGSILAAHICGLVSWLLRSVIGKGYSVSILDPSAKSQQMGYKEIVKLSVKRPDGVYIPILDLDFGNSVGTPDYFTHTFRIQGKIPRDTGMPVSFTYQSDRQMLAEKLYYYVQYFVIKRELTNADVISRLRLNPDSIVRTPYGNLKYEPSINTVMLEHNGEKVNVAMCDHFLDKFKRSIVLLMSAIMQSSPSSNPDARFKKTLERVLLIKLVENDDNAVQLILKQSPRNKLKSNIVVIVESIYSYSKGITLV